MEVALDGQDFWFSNKQGTFIILCSSMVFNKKKYAIEISVKYHFFHFVFGPLFTTYPIFQWYLQSTDILLNLSMTCCNST